MEQPPVYSEEIKSFFKEISFNKDYYSYDNLFKNIKFRKSSFTNMKVLTPVEARRLCKYYHSGIKMIKYFDAFTKLYVITSTNYGSEMLNVSYFTDEDCTNNHRDDGPACFHYDDYNKIILSYSWFKNNIPHRDGDLPQEVKIAKKYSTNHIYYYPHVVAYRKNGELHRNNNPAYIEFFNVYYTINNKTETVKMIKKLQWFVEGRGHNNNEQPSFVTFFSNYNNNTINMGCKIFKRNGDLHRFEGPAWIEKTWQEKIKYKRWYINGKRLDRRKFPYLENGKLKGNMLKDKGLILKTTLFDREYGQFIRGIIDSPKPS